MIPEQTAPPVDGSGDLRRSLTAVAVLDGDEHVITYASPVFTRWTGGDTRTGRRAEDVLGAVIGLRDLGAVLDDVRDGGRPYHSARDVWARVDRDGDGIVRDVRFSVSLVPLPREGDVAVLLVAVDDTAQAANRDLRQQQVARENLLLSLLSASTAELGAEAKLTAFARAAVPAVSDVCAVYLLAIPLPAGRMPVGPIRTWRIAAPTADGAIGPLAGRAAIWTGGDPASAAVASGRTVVVRYTPPAPPSWAAAAGVVDAIRSGRVHCTAMVPVVVDEMVQGLIAFGVGPDRAAYTPDDIQMFGLIAAQAAAAMREGGRYDRMREDSLVLQRAMLSAPPPVPGLDIAVRYRPAGKSAEVGGDWYDAFVLPDGDLAVVVGDVAGHDINAAAVMGQLRSMLRGFAVQETGPPDRTLTVLDRAIGHLRLTRLASCLYLTVGADEQADGLPLRWSNAGHPAPLLVDADGGVSVLEDPHDAALGVVHEAPRSSGHRRLAAGSTLLLFSDGLFERRRLDLDQSLALLIDTVRSAAGLELDALCDRLLSSAPEEDDVVLVALRRAPRS